MTRTVIPGPRWPDLRGRNAPASLKPLNSINLEETSPRISGAEMLPASWFAREPGRSCSCLWVRALEGDCQREQSRSRPVAGPVRQRERPQADTNPGRRPRDWLAKSISRRTCKGGSRSALIVPLTAGNRGHRDPLERSRGNRCVTCTDPLMGHAGGNSEFHQHVHETAVDSRAGEGASGSGSSSTCGSRQNS